MKTIRWMRLVVMFVLCFRMQAEDAGFSGVWNTRHGMMRLMEKEGRVTGCYKRRGLAEIEGTVAEGVMRFSFRESNGDTGTGEFRLDKKGAAFTGTWKPQKGKGGGEWNGTRAPVVKDRKWLVILEAHWEKNLQEQEYAYGNMLRQFFTRVPQVMVRHRFFDEKEDFARWCEDLPFFNEPVVLYVSSHGKEKGITVGKHVLDGAFIGRQLRYAPEVKLVHLGACLAMAGEVPHQIRKAAGTTAPVSGFTMVADWAGSAVVDFTYLDLVLARNMKPADAVRQLRDNVTFARDEVPLGCRIAPMDLKIVE